VITEPSTPFEPLNTGRLCLRLPTVADAPDLAALVTPAIGRWLASWPAPCTVSLATSRVTAMRVAAQAREAMGCVVELGSEVIGWIEVHRSQQTAHSAQLSYWIGEAHQGHGFAREAALHLVPEAFQFLDVTTIEAGAQLENEGSFAVMRALGMRYVDERSVYAASRDRHEACRFYALDRSRVVDGEV